MKDGHMRDIRYLRLSVTDLCNYRCQYCMAPEGVEKRPHSEILSVEECVEIGDAAVACGIRKIRLTGGEPLVRRGIVDICQGLSELNGLEELCLTTNGSLLPQLAGPLRRAGADRLNLSLDTLRPQRFQEITRLGSLGQVLDGIQAAEEAGFSRLKLNVVLMGGVNDDEIPDFIELTRTHPWEVRFIELMPMGPCAGWERSRFLSADEVLRRFSGLVPLKDSGVARRFQVPGWAGTVGLIEPMSHRFCSSCDRIRITADGRLKACLHSRQELKLRGLHGEALREAIRRGIASKPERHHLTEDGSETPRCMNEIGG
ncbi:GTP 3',8-cyclase MoaA [Oscillibacter hominis]|uniref:GTP 3',8-cyclase n=1 Tax=Oscillibacter hominis TaxID=2763056 RepID=A0A7G9B4M1_9FIRM|nr:GTP 3',8-cyclase MoaA [Oscillibacter hominis]QNL44502.1 GTP 3',8-cyclase MoaA [Oscillibacter hominis]